MKPPPDALQLGLRLISRRARTASELDLLLRRKQVPEAERKAVVARLRELGYMDDREVARARAQTLISKGNAPRLAARKLSRQGVTGEDARAAVDEAAGGAGEAELVARALQKRLRGRAPRDEKERQRIFRALLAKGHRASHVAAALKLGEAALLAEGQGEGDDEGSADD